MTTQKSILITLSLVLSSIQIQAQDLWQLWAARSFHQHLSAEEKVKTIRQFEIKGWEIIDTMIEMDGNMKFQHIELAPIINDMGESVYLVTEQSPEFPGSNAAFQDYLKNELKGLLAPSNEEAAYMIYYKFVVNTDGHIESIELAQPLLEWMSKSVDKQLFTALQNMPDWTPGRYRGKPVKTVLLAEFNLK